MDLGLPHIFLDISRLLSRLGRPAPTGIDRVELAYAGHALAAGADAVTFLSIVRGQILAIPREKAAASVSALRRAWLDPATEEGADGGARAAALPGTRPGAGLVGKLNRQRLARDFARLAAAHESGGVYLNVSHHGLEDAETLTRLKTRLGVRAVFFVHDTIPIDFPEYARPGDAARHASRVRTVEALADAVIVNSRATRASLLRHAPGLEDRGAPICVNPLWVSETFLEPPIAPAAPGTRPYFLAVGTIEARKNHLLLLQIWRQLVEQRDNDAPCLVIAGQRGWEASAALALIDRCAALKDHVIERPGLTDRELVSLMAGARALLFPSFAEGFGLPVAEALAAGTPVIAADLPVLREVAGEAPLYLSTLDGSGWLDAIHAYTEKNIAPAKAPPLPGEADHLATAFTFALNGPGAG